LKSGRRQQNTEVGHRKLVKNPAVNSEAEVIFKSIKTEFHNENKPGIIKIIED
jgi:hypothetical protein